MVGSGDWLKVLKVGDEVAVAYSFSSQSLATVERVTPTQVKVKGWGTYRKKDGYAVGSGRNYNRSRLLEVTADVRAKIQRKGLADKFAAMRWHDQPLATLQRVEDVLITRSQPNE